RPDGTPRAARLRRCRPATFRVSELGRVRVRAPLGGACRPAPTVALHWYWSRGVRRPVRRHDARLPDDVRARLYSAASFAPGTHRSPPPGPKDLDETHTARARHTEEQSKVEAKTPESWATGHSK